MPSELDEIKQLMQDTRKELALVAASVEKIRRRMRWSSVYGLLKLLIILVPLVLGWWYLQPQLTQLYQSWSTIQQSLQTLQGPNNIQPGPDLLQQVREQYPQLFK